MPTQHCECGAKYRFPESAIGKRARCEKCGTIITLQPEENARPVPLANEPDLLGDLATSAEQGDAAPTVPEEPPPVSMAYLPSADSVGRLGKVVIEEAERPTSYARSLVSTFLFPTSGGNLVTFVMVAGMLFFSNTLLRAMPGLGTIGQLIILGWYSAFRFSVIVDAAAGDKDLPGLIIEGGFEGILLPFLKWLGSWGVVLLPAFVYFLVLVNLGLQGATNPLTLMLGGIAGIFQAAAPHLLRFIVLVCVGLFLWPMVVLCVALGGFSTLARLDLTIITIVKTLPVYLLTVAIVFGADLLNGVLGGLTTGGSGGGVDRFLVSRLVAAGIGVYFEIVAMRAIGLYYHHFKHRFAWSWG